MMDLVSLRTAEQVESTKVSYKRTRRGKVRKTVRPFYFRDDISCGFRDCSICTSKDIADTVCVLDSGKPIIVIDCDTSLNQIDFVLQDASLSNCVICYTAINYVRNTSVAKSEKLRAICSKSASNDSNSRSFYAFANEFVADTFVRFSQIETDASERDFRAILTTCKWYTSHLSVPVDRVILLTNNEQSRDFARSEGVSSLTAWEFADSVRKEFPLAGEALAAPCGKAEPGTETDFVYEPHLSLAQINDGLRDGKLLQGILRMAMGTATRATVSELEIVGKLDLNRAFDGDVVAVEVLGYSEAALLEIPDEESFEEIPLESAVESFAERILDEKIQFSSNYSKRARVVGIIKRNWKEYSGTLRTEDGDESREDRMFVPTDPRIPFIRIRTRNSSNLSGKRIVAVVDSWERNSRSPSGHWVSILGKAGDRDTESDVILREHDVITRPFSKAVLECLPSEGFKPGPSEVQGRIDLRGIPVCSIDPPGCKDIDDALSCELLENGNFRVGVHIADVTHFVKPGTAIDREASERCTTVYLVEKRTDMLPGLLTADLCSLRQKVDRLCFSVVWEMTASGDIVSTQFHKAIINSEASLTYAAAQHRIEDQKDTSPLTISIRNLNLLAKRIRQSRMSRGALELASQEVRFELDNETRDPTDVVVYKSLDTNKLVEEFMVLANQSVARQILSQFPSTSVLRRHPPPREQQLSALKSVLEKHGFEEFKFGTNKELAESLAKINRAKDPYFNRLIRIMTTRCMNQASYFCTGDIDPGSYWHYGLAMDLYTHFTSPIRRYADVLTHRLLAASLGLEKVPDSLQTKIAIHNQCDTMNIKHKLAQLAGRASAELHIYLYFKRIGQQECDSIITRIRLTKGGKVALHVLSSRYGVEGVVTIPSGWAFDETRETATDISEGTSLAVFDHVMVKIRADDTNFRFRTVFEYLKKSSEYDVMNGDSDKDRKRIEQEMFQEK